MLIKLCDLPSWWPLWQGQRQCNGTGNIYKHHKNSKSCPSQVTRKVMFRCQICLPCLPCLSNVGCITCDHPHFSEMVNWNTTNGLIKGRSHFPFLIYWTHSQVAQITCSTSLGYFCPEEVAKCLLKWPAWKVSLVEFVRRLETVYKQDGGSVISYNLHLACIRKLEVNLPVWWIISQLDT